MEGYAPEPTGCKRFAGFVLDVGGRTLADPTGRDVPLRRAEFSLLQAFLRAPGRVLSRDHLLQAIAGRPCESYDRSVDVLVSLLRRKLESDPKSPRLIVTVVGAGYKFTERPQEVGDIAEPERQPGAAQPRAAERRQITIMHCTLADAAGLARGLDPEELRPLISAWQACCTRLIAEHGGTLARMLDCDARACFGYPGASEHDAERAVRAGLILTREAPRLDGRLHARVGIATGLAVVEKVADASTEAPAVFGEAPSRAAEMLAVAQPDDVVISRRCRRATGVLFAYEPITFRPGDVGRAFRVTGERAVESRFEAMRQPALTAFVGREEELGLLRRRWEQAREGRGRVVLIAGDPGMGKSRLVSELGERLAGRGRAAFFCSCAPARQGSAYHPFIDWLARSASFTRADDDATRFQKLQALLRQRRSNPEAIALLADLVSVPTPGPALVLTPQQRRERTAAALIGQTVGLAARAPRLVIFEDAHWADPSSRELLHLLVDRIAELPVLLIVTFRPEFSPPWTNRPHATTIVLNGLDRAEAAEMIAGVGSRAISAALESQIIDRAEGVPLFIEVLACAALDAASRPHPASEATASVPETLQSSLIARLDRMPDAKAAAQVAAVIGREFAHDLIAAVADFPEAALTRGLGELVGAGLVYRRGGAPDARYTFKHKLVQEAAYETLLLDRRQALHAAIANALTARREHGDGTGADVPGYHYERAGMPAEAARCYLRAGEQSAARSAMTEAAAHLARGLDLAAGMPAGAEQRLREAELLLALGDVAFAQHGYGSHEYGALLARAAGICRGVNPDDPGERKLAARALHGEALHLLFSGEIRRSLGTAEEMLALAGSAPDPEPGRIAAAARGTICFILGRPREAIQSVAGISTDQAIEGREDPMIHFGFDARSAPHRVRCRPLACLGFPHQATEQARAGVRKARVLSHAPTIAIALAYSSDAAWISGDLAGLREWASALVQVAGAHDFRHWRARGKAYMGWIAAADGQLAEGRALLAEAIREVTDAGILLYLPLMHAKLADVHAAMGQSDQAIAALDQALAIGRRSGEAWIEAELHRRKAVLRRGHPDAAEACFRQAIGSARKQSARLFELRAALGLARLWRETGRRDEARDLLAPIYHWFTEGLDLPDLVAARALLADLASAPPALDSRA